MNPLLASRLVLAAALLLSAGAPPQEKSQEKTPEKRPESFICPPCGAECHFKESPKPGSCGVCGMSLVPLTSVPQVGVLLFPKVGLVSSTWVLGVFADSNAARVFTVADTTEPLRALDALELRPQFAFAEAPPLDVLIVPDGFGAWDDPMVVAWVKTAAEHARFVLAVGAGSVVLARAGFLAGEHVPGSAFLVERGKNLSTSIVFEREPRWRRAGKFFLARDPLAAVDASLAVVQELVGVERARSTAEELGHSWNPVSMPMGAPDRK